MGDTTKTVWVCSPYPVREGCSTRDHSGWRRDGFREPMGNPAVLTQKNEEMPGRLFTVEHSGRL